MVFGVSPMRVSLSNDLPVVQTVHERAILDDEHFDGAAIRGWIEGKWRRPAQGHRLPIQVSAATLEGFDNSSRRSLLIETDSRTKRMQMRRRPLSCSASMSLFVESSS
jgi:hypothetical protein